MSRGSSPRLSLILPIDSRAALLAASQVVLSLLRILRVELDLLRGPSVPGAPSPSGPGRPGAILFVAANLPEPFHDTDSAAEFEQELRARVEHIYARHRISPIVYDLEII
jgi:hypothetical protein